MMKRSTWVMVVVLALLAGLAYYMQQPDNLIKKAQASKDTPTTEALGSLISPMDGPLNSLSIQKIGGETVTLTHASSGWTLVIGTGGTTPADQNLADQAASSALSLNLSGKISSTTPNLSVFGLDKPAYLFTVVLANGKSVSYKIGNATLAADGYYAQEEDGTIVILEKDGFDQVLNLLQQPPYMFTLTPSPTSVTGTPTPNATLSVTPTAGAGTPTGTMTPITELTSTKQP